MSQEEKKPGGEMPPGYTPRYVIGTPGSPRPKMLMSVMGLEKPPGTPFIDGGMGTPGRQKLDIASARNGLCEDFLRLHEEIGQEDPFNWLFMIDGDAVLHHKTMHRLSTWEKPLVGALCVIRYKPYAPVVYRGLVKETAPDMRAYRVQMGEVREWVMAHPELVSTTGFGLLDPAPEDALHAVDWTGTHCLLIHRTVLEKVPAPWFVNASSVKYGSGSDRLFFERCAEYGIQAYVDYSVVAGHEANMILGMADFMAWQSITIEEDGEDGDDRDPSVQDAPLRVPDPSNENGWGNLSAPGCARIAPSGRGQKMRDPFFVVTTGRSGSASIAMTLNQHPLLCVMHEAYQDLIGMAQERANGKTRSGDAAGWFLQRVPVPAGAQRVGLVDQKLVQFMVDLRIAYRDAQFVWLARDGRDVVASGYARGWYSEQEQVNPGHLWARHRLQGCEVGDVAPDVWEDMGAFGRNCWYWEWTNRQIREALRDVDGERRLLVRLEELATNPGKVGELQAWLGVPPMELEMYEANRGTGAMRWESWTAEQRGTFETLCGQEMDRLYPGWR